MSDKEIGFVLNVKSEQFTRAMREVEESRKRVDTIMAKGASKSGDGFLGIRRLRQSRAELRAISREQQTLKRAMDSQVAAGQKIAQQDKDRLQALEAQKRNLEAQRAAGWAKVGATVGGAGRAVGRGINRGSSMAGGAASFAMGNTAPMVNAISSIPLIGAGLGMVAAAALGQYAQGKPILMQNLAGQSAAGATTGADKGALGKAGNFGLSLAYSRAETLAQFGRYSQAAGGTGGFRESLQMQRGYGVDSGGMVSSARQMTTETSRSIQLALVRGIESGSFNRALAQEFASASSSLMSQIAAAGGQGSARNITALVAMLGKQLGGVYAKSPGRTAGILGGVNSALLGFAKGQGGDAKQAFMFEALQAANPKMGYVDLLMQAEKGVSDPENLSAMMKGVRRRYGGDRKMEALALSRLTGNSVGDSYNMMGTKDISTKNVQAFLAKGDASKKLKDRAKEATSPLGILKRQHALNEKRAALAAKMDKSMARYENLQMKAADKMGTVVDKLENAISGKNGGMMGLANEAGKAAGKVIAEAIKAVLPAWMTRGRKVAKPENRVSDPATPAPSAAGVRGLMNQ